MTLKWPFKDSNEILDYTVDWTDRLSDTDSIATSTFTISGPDSLLIQQSNSFIAKKTTIWMSGGTIKKTYSILNRVTTVEGRTMDQTVKLKIKEK